MENEILEGNKLIAEFMGVVYDKTFPCMSVWIEGDGEDATYFYCEWHPEYKLEGTNIIAWEFSPHKNWCQLMPVVEKIEDIGGNDECRYNVCIEINSCFIVRYFDGEHDERFSINISDASNKIEAVYKAVVEFIKWYNQK